MFFWIYKVVIRLILNNVKIEKKKLKKDNENNDDDIR